MFALISSACDKWTILPRPGLHRDTKRFGHSAVVSNGWELPFPAGQGLYLCGLWRISAGSLSLFTELPSSCKESIQLVNYIHGQMIHFQWIIHFHFFSLHFLDVLQCPKFWNPQPVSDFLCCCYPDSVWIVFSLFFISMLNLVYSVSCQFSHCWLPWCFRTTPHFTHRASFSCCSLCSLVFL